MDVVHSVIRRSLMMVAAMVGVLSAQQSSAQIFTITDGAINTCTGAILDSGGQGGPGYGNNESFIATICPDAPGGSISLNFVTFVLSAAGTSPVDRMLIYDGAGTSSTLLGTYTGNQLQGQILFASSSNPSGCLTIQFISNETGTGSFGASITCTTPCIPPTANATVGEAIPVLACQGEEFTFDGSASTAAAGFSIVSMEWDFDDGTTAIGAAVDHQFSEPGEYMVQLTVTDDNGCTNTNLVDLQILISTTPLFGGTTESQSVCQGATVDLGGIATATTWSATPVADFGDGVYLPDDVGQTFTSQLEFTEFTPGGTLTDVNDLLAICVDMEHSFMGDLVISITCPSGQAVVLHQQGGGGTFLGDANDNDGVDPTPGTCWNYCWSPTSTQGTWVQNSTGGATPNVMGNSSGTNSLIPGTYSSLNPLSGLLGCPLNGSWTISFTDLWGADNGFLCSWEIEFDPSLYPTLTQFTPVIGTTTDSLSWSGTGVTEDPTAANEASAYYPDPGVYDVVYSVTDNFGCEYDTTIVMTVTNAPVVELTSTLGANCNDPAQLHAEIIAFPPPLLSCDYTLVLNDSFDGIWQGGAQVRVVVNGVTTAYTMTAGGPSVFTIAAPPGATMSLMYTAGATFNGENSFTFIGPSGNVLYNSPNGPLSGTPWNGTSNCSGSMGPLTYIWSPAAAVSDGAIAEPLATVTVPTIVEVMVYPPGQPWCTTSDTTLVLPPSFLELDSIVTDVLCNGGDGSIELITTGLGGPWNYRWTNTSGTVIRTVDAANGDTLVIRAGTYEVIVEEGPNGNGCADTLVATINEPPPLNWTATPVDTLICLEGTALLSASTIGGTAPVALQWSQGLIGNGPHQVSPELDQPYTVVALDANGCMTEPRTSSVLVRDPITYVPFVDFDQCSGVPFTLSVVGLEGGDGNYSYAWNNSSPPLSSMEAAYTEDHSVCVVVSDGCETPAVTSCAFVTILHTPPLQLSADTTFGCAPFEVQFAFVDTTFGAVIDWNLGDGTLVDDGGVSLIHLYDIGDTYDVTTTVLWPNGCVTDTTIFEMVDVISVPVADFTWDPSPISIFEPTAHFQETAERNEISYEWDFYGIANSTSTDTSITFPTDVGRDYPVQLIVANELGCADSITRMVPVEDVFLVYIPNAFSPDGDGINEDLSVQGNDISRDEFEMRIFDRWGQEVFGTTDRDFRWNGGLQNGALLPIGVYTYRLKVRSRHTLQKKIMTGHITLIR